MLFSFIESFSFILIHSLSSISFCKFKLLQEIVAGPEQTMPEKMVMKQLMKQEVEKLLKTLSKREAQVLRLHLGLNGETPQSFEEIGSVLELSRERVRQINGIALSKLRNTSIVDYLRLYLYI